jgi:hypothetical protein
LLGVGERGAAIQSSLAKRLPEKSHPSLHGPPVSRDGMREFDSLDRLAYTDGKSAYTIPNRAVY